MNRTRVKFCGLTRAADVENAVAAGADAIGFNCYPASPRYVPPAALPSLVAALSPWVEPVLLFVDADPARVEQALRLVPRAMLQLHGRLDDAAGLRLGRPFLRALSLDRAGALLDCEHAFPSAVALLADTPTAAHGGSGRTFDWSLLPAVAQRRKPLILAGGLSADNVIEAIGAVQPYAVDVSSGIESSPGVKSRVRMEAFVQAVRQADQQAAMRAADQAAHQQAAPR